MPDRRLTQLPVLAALSADDIFYVVDDPAGAANSRQVAASVFDARYLQTANNLSDLTNVVVARASLGLGTLAVINSPLPIINGGSGQVTQQAAIDALTNVAAATNEYVLTKDTATGNAIFKVTATVLPVADTTAIIKGSVTATKQLRFEIDGFTAATTRVITPPDADITLAGQNYANVFTAAQMIDGSADAIQLRVQAVAAQTANLQTWENSAGALVGAITPSGSFEFGATAIDAQAFGFVYNAFTNDASNIKVGFRTQTYSTSSGVAQNKQLYGLDFEVKRIGAGVVSALTFGISGVTRIETSNNVTQAIYGMYGKANISSAAGAITASLLVGGQFEISNDKAGATATNAYALSISEHSAFTGTVSNMYGIRVGSQTGGASNNYAIFTNAGLNRFGDQVAVIGSADRDQLSVTGFTTQTNSPAVITGNTATTNAVLNSLRLVQNTTGTGAAGLGVALQFQIESSTTAAQEAARLAALWQTATHASRVADLVAYASYNGGEVEIWRGRAGAAPLFAVLGATPVVRQAHIADPAGGGTVDAES